MQISTTLWVVANQIFLEQHSFNYSFSSTVLDLDTSGANVILVKLAILF
jgi:hypothetical protein